MKPCRLLFGGKQESTLISRQSSCEQSVLINNQLNSILSWRVDQIFLHWLLTFSYFHYLPTFSDIFSSSPLILNLYFRFAGFRFIKFWPSFHYIVLSKILKEPKKDETKASIERVVLLLYCESDLFHQSHSLIALLGLLLTLDWVCFVKLPINRCVMISLKLI